MEVSVRERDCVGAWGYPSGAASRAIGRGVGGKKARRRGGGPQAPDRGGNAVLGRQRSCFMRGFGPRISFNPHRHQAQLGAPLTVALYATAELRSARLASPSLAART